MTGIISYVNSTGPAFSAGLRDGQQLVAVQEHPNDMTKMMVVTVSDHGTKKTIRFLPYIGKLTPTPQFVLNNIRGSPRDKKLN